MAQSVRLKLDGKTFDLHPLRPAQIKLNEFLSKAADDEIFTTSELSKRSNVSEGSLERYKPSGCTTVFGKNRYWGNPKAIAELLRQVKHEGE